MIVYRLLRSHIQDTKTCTILLCTTGLLEHSLSSTSPPSWPSAQKNKRVSFNYMLFLLNSRETRCILYCLFLFRVW